MKRYLFALMLLLAFSAVSAVAAQDTTGGTITLNDATPGIDLAISSPPGTTGAVFLQLSGVMVKAVDSAGNIVFHEADPRVHGVQLRFAPDSGPHTITVERLPDIAEGYLTALSQLDLTTTGTAQLISSGPLSLGQEFDAPLSASTPGAGFDLTIPDQNTSQVTASFPGAPVTAQVVDQSGAAVATLYASHIDGLGLTLDSGNYRMTLLNTDTTKSTVAATTVETALPVGLPTALATADTSAVVQQPVTSDCTVQIGVGSVNLRSGPGTGYNILNYAFRGDALPVGGTNPQQSWVLVGDANGSAWMDKTLGILSGNCATLAVFNIPYREASAPQVIVQPAPDTGSTAFGGGNVQSFGEHEDHEHDGGEHEGGGDD